MAIRITEVPISDALPIVLVDPANGDYYQIVTTAGGFTINRTNGTPIGNAVPVVLTGLDGKYYKGTGGASGSGFADQGEQAILAGDVSKAIVFNVTATDPIPILLYATWPAGAYIDPASITTTGFTVHFPVECPVGGGTIGWAYVET